MNLVLAILSSGLAAALVTYYLNAKQAEKLLLRTKLEELTFILHQQIACIEAIALGVRDVVHHNLPAPQGAERIKPVLAEFAGPALEHHKVQCLIHIYFPEIEPALRAAHNEGRAGLQSLSAPHIHFSAELLSNLQSLKESRSKLFDAVVTHAATINRPLWARFTQR